MRKRVRRHYRRHALLLSVELVETKGQAAGGSVVAGELFQSGNHNFKRWADIDIGDVD